MSCCDRLLIDTGYIGHECVRHEAENGHGWSYDGQVCCPERATRWHQVCSCKAGRWVDAPARAYSISMSDPSISGFRTVGPDEWPEMARHWTSVRVS